MRVDSAIGRGTAFTLYLPQVALPPPTTEEAYALQGSRRTQGRPLLAEGAVERVEPLRQPCSVEALSRIIGRVSRLRVPS